jgi:hypothetical protein
MSRIGNGIVTVKPQKKIRGYHVRTQCEKTALVVIDLQEGILPFAGGPHRADDVVRARPVWLKSAVSKARRSSWSALAGPLILPKR